MKRAIRVNIKDKKVYSIKSEYQCPACKTFVEINIPIETVRMRCVYCERELIIDKRTII